MQNNNSKNIICDTNIWYKIASGEITQEDFNDVRLIGTAINIIEIATSYNILNNLILLKETISALQKYHCFIIETNPFEHIISIFNPSFGPNSNIARHLDFLNDLEEITDINELTKEQKDYISDKIKKYDTYKKQISKMMNDVLNKSQNDFQSKSDRNNYKNGNFVDSWKLYFIHLTKEYSKIYLKNEFVIKEDDIRWNRLHFFLRVWSQYFRNKEIFLGSKFHDNDIYDLLNLVYVQPEFYYWTSEKRSWAKIIREDDLLKKSLYK